MAAFGRWSGLGAAACLVVTAMSAQGQSLNSGDLCAAIELARTSNSVTRIAMPLAMASDDAARDEKAAQLRLVQVRAIRDQEQQRVGQIEAEIAGKKFGAPSLADLDHAVEAARQRRAARAGALRAVLDARRTLAGREQQAQSDPGGVAQSSIDEARRNLATLERALEGELPLNQIDAEIAAAEAAAAARRAEIAEIEQRRTAARAVVAERDARVAEREAELAAVSARAAHLRREVAIVHACSASRHAQLRTPRDPPPVVEAPPAFQQPGYVPPPVYVPDPSAPPPGYVPAPGYVPQPVYDAPPPAVVEYPAPVFVAPPVTINIPIGSRPPRDRYDGPAFHRPPPRDGRPPDRMSGQGQGGMQPHAKPPAATMQPHAKPPGTSPASAPSRVGGPPPGTPQRVQQPVTQQRLSSQPPPSRPASGSPPARIPARKGEPAADGAKAE